MAAPAAVGAASYDLTNTLAPHMDKHMLVHLLKHLTSHNVRGRGKVPCLQPSLMLHRPPGHVLT